MKEMTIPVYNRMLELQEKVKKAAQDYYNGTESMSNYEYDKLYDELQQIEEEYDIEDRVTSKVGAAIEAQSGLPKVKHEYEAKSLGKTKSVDELIKEQSKTSDGMNGKTCLSWKLDGCTVQLTYNNGELQLASTRGDGKVGQEITQNSLFIDGIPQTIDYKRKLVVRGEALMSYAEFDRLNTDGQYANPRNLASATITALDKELLTQRHIDFKAFELVYSDLVDFGFSENLKWLQSKGFAVVPHEVVALTDLKEKIAEWSEVDKINAFGYPVDGLVVAYDDTNKVKGLEGTEHHPSLTKSMAFKWQDEKVQTKLTAIEWSPSRTGLLNPVAVFDTVDLCGTKVSRASLHNVSYIQNLNLKVGDNITVYKANMIIPQIAENLDRDKGQTEVMHGVECPCCKKPATIKDNNGTQTMVCENEKCLAKEIGTFVHFTEKHGMNIEGLSEKSLLVLMENGIITELADLYRLGEKDRAAYTSIEGLGDKAFDNLLASIERSKKTDTEHFLYACGIDGISRGQIKEIVGYLKANYDGELKEYQYDDGSYDLLGMLRCMEESGFDYTKINGIGEVLDDNLSKFIERELIEPEYGHGFANCLPYLTFEDKPLVKAADGRGSEIEGKTFVITGTLENFANRDELVAKIESLGGKVSGSVSKNTTFLINNDITSTSGKNKKAQDLGIPIISEKDFLDMIDDKAKENDEQELDKE